MTARPLAKVGGRVAADYFMRNAFEDISFRKDAYMRKKIDFKSEDGAALVLEAVIVYPIALVAVMFLILWGVTYLQRGYLQYCSSQLSGYIAKTIVYPGYEKIDAPFYTTNSSTILQSVNNAMDVHNPYRYLLGLDDEIENIIKKSKTEMTDNYIPDKGFLRAAEGLGVKIPDDLKGFDYQSPKKNGYTCAISAKSGFARVYIAQNYVFADFLRMIGLGGRKMTIYGDSLQYMSDSVELVRVTDWALDTVETILDKTGLGGYVDKIKSAIDKIMNIGNS